MCRRKQAVVLIYLAAKNGWPALPSTPRLECLDAMQKSDFCAVTLLVPANTT